MASLPRHQCLIYEGAPLKHLPAVSAAICRKLRENYRCLYLNSAPMVAGFRSYLAASGLDVIQQEEQGNLLLISEQSHLRNGQFDIDGMIQTLAGMLDQALSEGYAGLWATGDMTWEFGPSRDLSKLLEYEFRLDEFIREHPQMGGVCQYHADTLPHECLYQGLVAHPLLFVNETLSRINPSYSRGRECAQEALVSARLEDALNCVLRPECLD